MRLMMSGSKVGPIASKSNPIISRVYWTRRTYVRIIYYYDYLVNSKSNVCIWVYSLSSNSRVLKKKNKVFLPIQVVQNSHGIKT